MTVSGQTAQAPLLAYNHFVEAVFVLNDSRPGLQAAATAYGDSQVSVPGSAEGSI